MDVYPPLDIGTDFLGYRIEEQIGRGGMGVVYRAYDLRLKRPVALKLVAPSLARDPRFRTRFARESELAMSLEHPNVVPIYDAGEVDGRVYLAMRLVDGTDLGSVLRDQGALEPARAVAICAQIATALDAAHAKGLVHRDVKPSNVLLDSSEHVYLADFGLTRRFDEPGSDVIDGRSIGTPAYVAPEQLEGKPVDGRADVYSLGCLLHECLTGERVFPRGSRLAVAWAHLEEEPPRASGSRRDLPEAIDHVVARAMAKEPEERYPTCAAVVVAAEDALGLRTGPVVGRRTLVVASVLVVLLAIAAVAGTVLLTRGGGAQLPPPATHDDTLVRIDPATNLVTHVIDVGSQPMAVAAAGSRVWVYSRVSRSISEVDSTTNRVLHTTRVRAKPPDISALHGPVLAADRHGAWLIGFDARRRFLLARLPIDGSAERDIVLDGRPEAVTVGDGSVWVLARGAHGAELHRLDASTGQTTALERFSGLRIDSLTVGLGAVWGVSSSTAVLYRIDPRSLVITRHADLGTTAGQPRVWFGSVWVSTSDHGGDTMLVDPDRLVSFGPFGCCPLRHDSYDVGGFGSTWVVDSAKGAVIRWDDQTFRIAKQLQITDSPSYDGSCLTSIVTGAQAVWVTLARPNHYYGCELR
jgi:DNA-binding beta-propeller fold protein YncE